MFTPPSPEERLGPTFPSQRPERVVVRAGRGFLFWGFVFCAAGFAGLGAMAWAVSQAADGALVFGTMGAAAAAASAPFARRWEFVVDAEGIHLFRGGKVRRRIVWDDLRRVRYGETLIAFGGHYVHAMIPAETLQVVGRSRGQRVWIGTRYYSLDRTALSQATSWILEEALRRDVPLTKLRTGETTATNKFRPRWLRPDVPAEVRYLDFPIVLGWSVFLFWFWGTHNPSADTLAAPLFFSIFPFVVGYYAFRGRRYFCHRCDTYHLFVPKRGTYRCMTCRTPYDPISPAREVR